MGRIKVTQSFVFWSVKGLRPQWHYPFNSFNFFLKKGRIMVQIKGSSRFSYGRQAR
jgi:hypothetical protein